MRDYELMVVLDANLDEGGIETAKTRIEGLITQRGGTIKGTDAWGRRRLAYPIGRHRDGDYTLYRVDLPAEAGTEIERQMSLIESLIRHLLVRAVAPAPPPPSRAQ